MNPVDTSTTGGKIVPVTFHIDISDSFCTHRFPLQLTEDHSIKDVHKALCEALNIFPQKGELVGVASTEDDEIKPLEFPAPPSGEEWHNPDGLTPEQVEISYEWRLLLSSEIQPTPTHKYGCDCEIWQGRWVGETSNWGASRVCTYRTRRPLPPPKKRVPLGGSDLTPVAWYSQHPDTASLIVAVCERGFQVGDTRKENFITWEQAANEPGSTWSPDRVTWTHMSKEAE